MEEYIKVRYLIDILEKRLVFQEEHGFYRDAGYTSRFIDSIADIPREDVVAKGEYDKLKWQFDEVDHECDRLEEIDKEKDEIIAKQRERLNTNKRQIAELQDKLEQVEAEIAKKIFADIFDNLPYRQNCQSQDIEFGYEWGLVEASKAIKALKKKYKVED